MSSMTIVCWHCPVFPQLSAIVYVLVTVRGHVPASVCVIVKDAATIPQLSVAVPPPAMNAARVLKAGGIDPVHSKF